MPVKINITNRRLHNQSVEKINTQWLNYWNRNLFIGFISIHRKDGDYDDYEGTIRADKYIDEYGFLIEHKLEERDI